MEFLTRFYNIVLLFGVLMVCLSDRIDAQDPILPVAETDASPAPNSFLNNFSPTLDDRRPLEIGDTVSFQILEEGGEAVSLAVASSGEIDFPLIGRLAVAGKTCRAIAGEVRKRLEKTYYRRATVSLALTSETSASLGRFFVTGQVVGQGPIELQRGQTMTVAQAILHAGGFSDFADKRRVRLIRPGPDGISETFKVDVKAILEEGKTERDMVVEPGDYILVPERLFNF